MVEPLPTGWQARIAETARPGRTARVTSIGAARLRTGRASAAEHEPVVRLGAGDGTVARGSILHDLAPSWRRAFDCGGVAGLPTASRVRQKPSTSAGHGLRAAREARYDDQDGVDHDVSDERVDQGRA